MQLLAWKELIVLVFKSNHSYKNENDKLTTKILKDIIKFIIHGSRLFRSRWLLPLFILLHSLLHVLFLYILLQLFFSAFSVAYYYSASVCSCSIAMSEKSTESNAHPKLLQNATFGFGCKGLQVMDTCNDKILSAIAARLWSSSAIFIRAWYTSVRQMQHLFKRDATFWLCCK